MYTPHWRMSVNMIRRVCYERIKEFLKSTKQNFETSLNTIFVCQKHKILHKKKKLSLMFN